ncbi:unnamed protein product [Closterium sp. Yama58-4]|nr:unnamed protein product [Closterium sp. Yama58-4]
MREVHVDLYIRGRGKGGKGKGPACSFAAQLLGWHADRLDVAAIKRRHGLKALFALSSTGVRGLELVANPRNGLSLTTYTGKPGSRITLDGEPQEPFLSRSLVAAGGLLFSLGLLLLLVSHNPHFASLLATHNNAPSSPVMLFGVGVFVLIFWKKFTECFTRFDQNPWGCRRPSDRPRMSSMSGRSHRTVYVGNLPGDTRESEVEDLFAKYGKILDIELKLPPRPPGFAFVEFADPRDAEDAIRGRDGYDFDGNRLRVELAHGGRGGGGFGGGRGDFQRGPSRRTEYRVIVKNLPTSASWQDLKDHMRRAGDVCFAQVFKERDGMMGIVDYSNEEDMKYAVRKLDDSEFKNPFSRGCYIRVREESKTGRDRSRSPRRRERSRSRSRSRSASGSRSRSRSKSKSRSRSPKKSGSKSPSRSRSRSKSPAKSPERARSPAGSDGKAASG